jgi:hypothetical protein
MVVAMVLLMMVDFLGVRIFRLRRGSKKMKGMAHRVEKFRFKVGAPPLLSGSKEEVNKDRHLLFDTLCNVRPWLSPLFMDYLLGQLGPRHGATAAHEEAVSHYPVGEITDRSDIKRQE